MILYQQKVRRMALDGVFFLMQNRRAVDVYVSPCLFFRADKTSVENS